jgi:hypothetical protein
MKETTHRKTIGRVVTRWSADPTEYLHARIDEQSERIDMLLDLIEAQQAVSDALSDQVDVIANTLVQRLKGGRGRGGKRK